jgi:predicted transcriptional regulator
VRINPVLKDRLEQIAAAEERTVSQICELLLRQGAEAYRKEGAKYLQRFLSRQKKGDSSN